MIERYGWGTKGHDRDLLNRCKKLSKFPPRSAKSGASCFPHINVVGFSLKDETSTDMTGIKHDA